jgi:hypothetical protein
MAALRLDGIIYTCGATCNNTDCRRTQQGHTMCAAMLGTGDGGGMAGQTMLAHSGSGDALWSVIVLDIQLGSGVFPNAASRKVTE